MTKKTTQHYFEDIKEISEKVAEDVEISDDDMILSDNFDDIPESISKSLPIEDETPEEKIDKSFDLAKDEVVKDIPRENEEDALKASLIRKKSENVLANNTIISFNNAISKKLPNDFNLEEIGNIDLKAAEEIAKEDILFLTEDDLIEGLEDFELIPLDEQENQQADEKLNEKSNDIEQEKQAAIVSETVKSEIKADSNPENVDTVADLDSTEIESSPIEIIEKNNETTLEEEPLDENFLDDDLILVLEKDIEETQNEHNFTVTEDLEVKQDEKIEEPFTEKEESILHSEAEEDVEAEEFDDDFERTIEKEFLPEEYSVGYSGKEKVFFIDDEGIEKNELQSVTHSEIDLLERYASELGDTVEGTPIVLKSFDSDGQTENIAPVSRHSSQIKDMLVELEENKEYNYIDNDLDFVSSSIFAEDYSKYIREIDNFYLLDNKNIISTAIEILGLTRDETHVVEDKLYSEEYKGIDLDGIVDFFYDNFSDRGKNVIDKFINYILPTKDSFSEQERKSIEEDISSKGAIIFEENINDIYEKLNKKIDDTPVENVKVSETIYDITDQIVILEDDLDVDRFIKEIPEEKQVDMKKLLKYLDGLFEKLPEATIKNFADSEYFDLYVKVLNEMGA